MTISDKFVMLIRAIIKIGIPLFIIIGIAVLVAFAVWLIDLHESKKVELEQMERREEWKKRKKHRR